MMTGKSKIILYVDDDEDDRELFCEIIQQRDGDVHVDVAENGLRALEYLHEKKSQSSGFPCLVVIDINMPYLDGRETCQKLQEDRDFKNLSVVILTSSQNPVDRKHFEANGIKFFSKPDNLTLYTQMADNMLQSCK